MVITRRTAIVISFPERTLLTTLTGTDS